MLVCLILDDMFIKQINPVKCHEYFFSLRTKLKWTFFDLNEKSFFLVLFKRKNYFRQTEN